MVKLNAFFQFPMDDNFQKFYNMERRADITEPIETQQRDNEPLAKIFTKCYGCLGGYDP